MFIFDQLKREDRRLQLVSATVALGMLTLLGGLWYVQVVNSKKYEDKLQGQTFRSVRLPGTRGQILDRNGEVLAGNQPRYNLDIYLEEALKAYDDTNTVRTELARSHGVKRLTSVLRKEAERIDQTNRFNLINDMTLRSSTLLKNPLVLRPEAFFDHLKNRTYVPFPIINDLSPVQRALYFEQLSTESSFDLDVQPVRYYPNGSVAAHLMGYIRKKNSRDEDEDFSCQYYLPYYKGFSGLEYVYDDYLKGTPGVKWVLVNNASFRQREETKVLAGAGSNLFLTIDLRVQKAAEKAFEKAAHTIQDGIMEGAAVVMDVRNGDILAMASSPTYDPNLFASGITTAQNNYLQDKKLRPTVNRATEANYPGSVFKIITSIACLENGLDPNSQLTTHGEYRPPRGGRGIGDTVPGGRYAFDEAFYRSSNEYFCENGVQAGYRRIVDVGRRFHLGELTEIGFGLETRGTFPVTDDSEYMKNRARLSALRLHRSTNQNQPPANHLHDYGHRQRRHAILAPDNQPPARPRHWPNRGNQPSGPSA